MATPWPDVLRLLAIPVLGWAAWRDYRTRRVAARLWYPVYAVGLVALGWDLWAARGGVPGPRFLALEATIGVGVATALAYGFWWVGWFGRADRKGIVAIAVVFALAPTYRLGGLTLPLVRPSLGLFPMTVLTDGVLVGAAYPLAVAARNAAAGRFRPLMFIGRPVEWRRLPDIPGKLLETPGGLSTDGLDLDALRMYLRWRGLTLGALRAAPARYRDPASLPAEPNPPTDGAVDLAEDLVGSDSPSHGGRGPTRPRSSAAEPGDDPWGAEAFLESIEGSAYGTTPERLRGGLELVAERDRLWVSPGLPFLVPLFVGTCLAVVYGDLLFSVLGAIGLIPG